jgi:hypothetical protein
MFSGQMTAWWCAVYIPFCILTKGSIPWGSMVEGIPGLPYFEYNPGMVDNYGIGSITVLPLTWISYVTWTVNFSLA